MNNILLEKFIEKEQLDCLTKCSPQPNSKSTVLISLPVYVSLPSLTTANNMQLASQLYLVCLFEWAIPEKSKQEGLRIYFFENLPGIYFLLYPWKFQAKHSSTPGIPQNSGLCLEPLEISRPKTKTPGNSTLFFLGHPWKFHFVFN